MLRKIVETRLIAIENILLVIAMLLLALLPSAELGFRTFFKTGIYGNSEYVRHLCIIITFICAVIGIHSKSHLAFSIGANVLPKHQKKMLNLFLSWLSILILVGCAMLSYSFISLGFDPHTKVGVVRAQWIAAIMPIGYCLMAVHTILLQPTFSQRIFSASAVVIGGILFSLYPLNALPPIPLTLFCMVLLAIAGLPLFLVFSALAVLLILNNDGSASTIANEAYSMLTSPAIPTIPLFTLAGFILSESKASARFMNLLSNLCGWFSGGLAVAAIIICTFFTSLTGASGVTILAVGGLLMYVLTSKGYPERFTTGLLTVNGVGTLFPPSLPIIMYAVIAQQDLKRMLLTTITPGIIMLVCLSVYVIIFAKKNKVATTPFNLKAGVQSIGDCIWELLLPVIVIGLFFFGIITIVESAALTVLYLLLVEVVIKKDISLKSILPIILKSAPIIGGILIILASAKALSYYLVDAEVPMNLTTWFQNTIHSKIVFLILLNILLILIGCVMDIFSAIIVTVPLLLPLAQLFNISPIHLGVIFLANLELGYLTPTVGINVFLSSYRFEKPLLTVSRSIIPFFLVLLASVILITYLPLIFPKLIGQ